MLKFKLTSPCVFCFVEGFLLLLFWFYMAGGFVFGFF